MFNAVCARRGWTQFLWHNSLLSCIFMQIKAPRFFAKHPCPWGTIFSVLAKGGDEHTHSPTSCFLFCFQQVPGGIRWWNIFVEGTRRTHSPPTLARPCHESTFWHCSQCPSRRAPDGTSAARTSGDNFQAYESVGVFFTGIWFVSPNLNLAPHAFQ